jgi:hypothetical protein
MFRSYFLTKAMQLWNWATDTYQHIRTQLAEVYHHARVYYCGLTRTWVFIHGHSLPLPISHIKNKVNPTWIYSNHLLTSVYQPADTTCKLSWLSAKIIVVHKDGETEYDIDSFLSAFRLYAHKNVAPSLTQFFLCWCAQTNQWFPADTIVQFHVIDHQGEEQILTLGVDNHCFVIREQKVYHQVAKRIHSSHELSNAYEYYHPC